MKQFLGFSLLLIACWASVARAEDSELKALEEISKDAKESKDLLVNINEVAIKTEKALVDQQEVLKVLGVIEVLVGELSVGLAAQSDKTAAALFNVSREGEEYSRRTQAELQFLARLQEGTAVLLEQLSLKMEAYQQHVLDSSKKIDQDINELAKLVTRTVLPKLNDLKFSFDNLETSQINVEVELKNLAGIKDSTDESNHKLDVLEEQLKQLNSTQEVRLNALIGAINHLQPLNTWKVEGALRELIISQKRIELDLEQCSRQSSPWQGPQGYPEIPHSPSYGIEPQEPEYSQAQPKQVDLVQVWNVKEPQQHGEQPAYKRVTAYAQSPEPKNTQSSWPESLPWESASQYYFAPEPYQQPAPEPYKQPASGPYQQPAPVAPHQTAPPQSFQPQPVKPQAPREHQPYPDVPYQPHQQAYKPQSYQGQTFRPQPVQPGESYRIWYGEDALPKGY
ncbi:hypothetical protein KR018_010729 [Drosophila ironensis]|nr:hypothetical protein KR018_010729 [Drosophila ironensis]